MTLAVGLAFLVAARAQGLDASRAAWAAATGLDAVDPIARMSLQEDMANLLDVQATSPAVLQQTLEAMAHTVAVGRGGAWPCTGVLVAPGFVLTAAHCLPADQVAFGLDVKAPWRRLEVVATARHPRLDLALLQVRGDEPAFWYRLTWRLPEDGPRGPTGPVVFVGFGASDRSGRGGEGTLRYGTVDVAGWGCTPDRARWYGCDPGTELLVLTGGRVDACAGDSGGPLFELVEAPGGMPSAYFRLVGVTVRGVPGPTACGAGGVYTRVDVVAAWMSTQIHALRASTELP